jgi:hypothetical protein
VEILPDVLKMSGCTKCAIKEKALNNLPISQFLWNSPAVPFGEELVENDLHGLPEPRGILAAGFVCLAEDAHVDLQAL